MFASDAAAMHHRGRWTAWDLETERQLATIFCRYPRTSHLHEPPYYPWVYHHPGSRSQLSPHVTFNLGYNPFASSSSEESE